MKKDTVLSLTKPEEVVEEPLNIFKTGVQDCCKWLWSPKLRNFRMFRDAFQKLSMNARRAVRSA